MWPGEGGEMTGRRPVLANRLMKNPVSRPANPVSRIGFSVLAVVLHSHVLHVRFRGIVRTDVAWKVFFNLRAQGA